MDEQLGKPLANPACLTFSNILLSLSMTRRRLEGNEDHPVLRLSYTISFPSSPLTRLAKVLGLCLVSGEYLDVIKNHNESQLDLNKMTKVLIGLEHN